MKRFGLLFFLLILAIVESTTVIHLSLATAIIFLSFVPVVDLLWWFFIVGVFLDLLLGNFLGVNALLLILAIVFINLGRNFLWHNLTYENFPSQTIAVTIVQVFLASRLYDFFYSALSTGVAKFNFDLRVILAEIIITLILFPIISYLSLRFSQRKQLELKF